MEVLQRPVQASTPSLYASSVYLLRYTRNSGAISRPGHSRTGAPIVAVLVPISNLIYCHVILPTSVGMRTLRHPKTFFFNFFCRLHLCRIARLLAFPSHLQSLLSPRSHLKCPASNNACHGSSRGDIRCYARKLIAKWLPNGHATS